MEVNELLDKARSVLGADRVFGEPVERDGTIVIPAAHISGGGGGGADEDSDGGGGFGVRARPAGALVIGADGGVQWKVPFDLNRVILGGQLVAVAHFVFAWLTRRSAARATVAVAVIARRAA